MNTLVLALAVFVSTAASLAAVGYFRAANWSAFAWAITAAASQGTIICMSLVLRRYQ